MSDPRASRKSAVIVSADVAGHGRLVAADEESRTGGLRGHQREPIDPRVPERGGRIANTAGDSFLIALPSVAVPVHAVNGLAQGVQLIGRRYLDDLGFDAAEAIEQRRGVFTPIAPLDAQGKV